MSDDDPYRRGAGAPAALVELAAGAAAKRRELPRDAAALANRLDRAQRALDIRAAPGLISVLSLVPAGIFFSIGLLDSPAIAIAGVLFVPAGIWLDVATYRNAKARALARIADGEAGPYRVVDYVLWLAAERPLFDVYLRRDVDRRVVTDAVAAMDPDIAVEWLEDRVFRVAIPSRRIGAEPEEYVGDAAAWRAFKDKILAPLAQDVGIERVEMGGSMRALISGRG